LKRIILITSNELRHDFFRKYLASFNEISVLKSYCEIPEKNLLENILTEDKYHLRNKHLIIREQSEKDFFELFCSKIDDKSNPLYISKGTINSDEIVNEIKLMNPDLIVSYGCSIIKSSLLDDFNGKFINIHLGLSPYYRGSGTNFFPFVNDEISCVGATFMYIDEGIDTGKIIHQMRPTINYGDSIHQIGNRLICEMVPICQKLIIYFDDLKDMNPIRFNKKEEKVYRTKDFTEEAVEIMYQKFASGIVEKYINDKIKFDSYFPILQNPKLK